MLVTTVYGARRCDISQSPLGRSLLSAARVDWLFIVSQRCTILIAYIELAYLSKSPLPCPWLRRWRRVL